MNDRALVRTSPILALLLALVPAIGCGGETPETTDDGSAANVAGTGGPGSSGAAGADTGQEDPAQAPLSRPADRPQASGLAAGALAGTDREPDMATLKVRVVLDEDGSPVAGARVRVLWKFTEQEVGRDFKNTDADGYAIWEMYEGTLIQSLIVEPSALTAPVGEAIKKLVRSDAPLEVELRLERASFVSGWVRDLDGNPVPNAELRCWFKGRWDTELESQPAADILGRTNEDGVFSMGGLPTGGFTLEAFAEGMACTRRTGGKIGHPGQVIDGVELQLAPAATVFGLIVGPNDEPVVDALVVAGMVGRHANRVGTHVEKIFYFPSRQHVVRTDSDGAFLLPDVPKHEMWVTETKHNDYQPLRERLLPGQGSLDLRLEAGITISGKVLDAEGEPVGSAFLRLYGEQERNRRTGKQGGFKLKGLLVDPEAALLVYAPGHAVQRVWPLPIERGTDSLQIRLSPSLGISGQLVDASGAPVAGAALELRGPDPVADGALADCPAPLPEKEFGLGSTQTGTNGQFQFLDLYEGEFEMRIRAPGRAAQTRTVRSGQENLRIEL